MAASKGENLGAIFVEIKAKTDKLERELKELKGKSELRGKQAGESFNKGFSGKLKTLGSSIKGFFKFAGLTAVVTAFFAAFRKGFNDLKEFQVGMRNVNTILNLSEPHFKKMSKEVLTLARQLGVSGKSLTDALYQATSAGIEAGQAVQFLGIAGKAAKAGLATTEQAVDGITTILNAFHLKSKEATRVADIMFKTVKLGKTTFSELSEAISIAANIAASSGVNFEQVAGAIATLTKQGIPTTVAMTQIRQSIVGLNKHFGDGWSKTMSLQEAMGKLAKETGGSQTALQKIIGRIEGVNAVLGLTGKNAKMAASDLNEMANSAGAMAVAYSEQTKSMNDALNKVSVTISQVFQASVEKITPIILGFANGLKWVAEKSGLLEDDLSKLTSRFVEQKAKMQNTETEVTKLLKKYKDLKEKTKPTTAEQAELKKVIGKIAGIIPGAITQVDDYGTALDISTGAVTRFLDAQRLMLQRTKESVFGDIKDEVKDAIKNLDQYNGELNRVLKERKKFAEYKAKGKDEIVTQHTLLIDGGDLVMSTIQNVDNVLETYDELAGKASAKTAVYNSKLTDLIPQLDLFYNLATISPDKLAAGLGISIKQADSLIAKFKEMNKVIENPTTPPTLPPTPTPKPKVETDSVIADYYDTLKWAAAGYYAYRLNLINKQAAAYKKANNSEIDAELYKTEAIKALDKEQLDYNKSLGNEEIKDDISKTEILIKNKQAVLDASTRAYEQMREDAQYNWDFTLTGYQSMQAGIYDMFSSIEIRAKKNANALERGFTSMANMFIHEVERMIAKWLALQAVMFIGNMLLGDMNVGAMASHTGGNYKAGSSGLTKAHTGGTFTTNNITKMAGGGSMIVPAGYPHDSYPLMVESGERVSVSSVNKVNQQELLLNRIDTHIQALNLNMMTDTNRGNETTLNHQISGRFDGRDLVMSYDKSKSIERRIG